MSTTIYIGTKIIAAEPMTRQAYNDFRGWQLPADENGADEGYLVEYQDGGPANVPGRAGYVSWSPKAVFELSYRPTDRMTFGDALVFLKNGISVTRPEFDGMTISMERGAIDGEKHGSYDDSGNFTPKQECIAGVNIALFDRWTKGITGSMPYLQAHIPGGPDLRGWLPSQTDMLAEDWQLVESA